jgi:hypothetical protein
MQGNKIVIATNPHGGVCPCKLLILMRAHTGGMDDAFIFKGFNGRWVKSSPERASPGESFITYA